MKRWSRPFLAAVTFALGLAGAAPAALAQAEAASPVVELPTSNFALSTLDRVRQRGFVICAATQPLAGFSQIGADGLWSGFDVDICRAVAAAVFGDPTAVEFRPLSGNSRFAHLEQGDIDLLSRNGTWTAQRDTRYGATYVGTSFYDGEAFMVPNTLGVVSAYELEDIIVCLQAGSDSARRVREFFFAGQVRYEEVMFEDREDLMVAYRSGRCSAIAAPASWLQAIRRGLPEPGRHVILPERLSKDPFGPVVRSNDPQWADIVRWTLFAMIYAEELGVTSQNIESLSSARTQGIRFLLGQGQDLGTPLGLSPSWMRDVVRGVGNYGEVYDRHFGSGSVVALQRGQNGLWTTGGLMFSPPFI